MTNINTTSPATDPTNLPVNPPAAPPPGRWSTEWWSTLAVVVLAALVQLGAITSSDQQTLQSALLRMVDALAVMLPAAAVVWRYIAARTRLKELHLSRSAEEESRWNLAAGREGAKAPFVLIGVLAAFLLCSDARAQSPAPAGERTIQPAPVEPTCLFGRNREQQPRTDPAILSILQQISNQNAQLIALLSARDRDRDRAEPRSAPPQPERIYILPQGYGYAPQPLPQGYNPQPLPQGYAPQPLPQGYAPQPLPQGYAPAPLPQGFTPQPLPQTAPQQQQPQLQPSMPRAGSDQRPAPQPQRYSSFSPEKSTFVPLKRE